MPRQQAAQDIEAAARCDRDNDADRTVRVPGCIGAGLGGEHASGGEKGGAEQQVAAEGHGGKIQICLKSFSLKSRKTSKKRFYFLFTASAKRFSLPVKEKELSLFDQYIH
jgi:hypothetical protein